MTRELVYKLMSLPLEKGADSGVRTLWRDTTTVCISVSESGTLALATRMARSTGSIERSPKRRPLAGCSRVKMAGAHKHQAKGILGANKLEARDSGTSSVLHAKSVDRFSWDRL